MTSGYRSAGDNRVLKVEKNLTTFYLTLRMFSVLLLIALLVPSISWGADSLTCEDILSPSIDASICDDIRSTVFIFRYAIRDIDAKVR